MDTSKPKEAKKETKVPDDLGPEVISWHPTDLERSVIKGFHPDTGSLKEVRLKKNVIDFDQIDKPTDEPGRVNPYEDFTFISDILDAPPIEWLIENVLFDRSFSILGSYTGFGKSLLALSIAKSIAAGSSLFDRYKVNRTGRVLYVDEENAHSDLKDRITRMGIDKKSTIYFLSFKGILLDEPEHFSNLMEVILKMQPVLVIFDSLVRFHTKNENDASEMSRVMAKFRKITNEGIGCLVLHHHNKGMGPLELRTRGSSDIVGICDVEYSIWKQGDDLILSTVKSRRAHMDNLKLSIEGTEDSLKIRCLGTAEDERKMMMMAIDDMLKEQPSSISEIADCLKNGGYKIGGKSLKKLVLDMCGKYIKQTTGRYNKQTFSSLAGAKLK